MKGRVFYTVLAAFAVSPTVIAQNWESDWDTSDWSWTYTPPRSQRPVVRNERQLEFANAMRKLWEDHILWTRNFIISAAGDLPDKEASPHDSYKTKSTSATRSSPITETMPATS